MKTLKITTEWILETFPMTVYTDGNGKVTISTSCFSEGTWIELALECMNIDYESYDIIDDETNRFVSFWEFKIQAIKDDCPKLYKEWMKNDLLNSTY